MLALAAGTRLVLTSRSRAEETNHPVEASLHPTVTVAGAFPARIQKQVSVTRTLQPRDGVLMFPESVDYAIDKLLINVSGRVEAGNVLARAKSLALAAQLAQAQASTGVQQAQGGNASAKAKRKQSVQTLDRKRQLHTSGTATQASLDEGQSNALTSSSAIQSAQAGFAVAEAQFHQADANLWLAHLNLADFELLAPVGGIVPARKGQVGSNASATRDPILEIIHDGLVEAEVIETHLGRIAQEELASLDSTDVGKMSGSVKEIRPVLDPAIGLATGGEFRAPMAIAVIEGLLVSTTLSPMFVPSLFSVIESVRSWLASMLVRASDFERFMPSATGKAGAIHR